MNTSTLSKPISSFFPATLENGLAVLILSLALLTRFAGLGDRAMSHDEINHVVPSYELSQGKGYHYDPVTHGPLQFHLIALSYSLFGDSDFTSRIPAAAFSVLTIGIALLAYRRYLGRVGALAAGLLFLISPYMLFYGRYARNEAFIVVWGLLTLFAILWYLETGRRRALVLFVLANALHFTDKATAYIFAAEQLLFLSGYLLYRLTHSGRGYCWAALRQERSFDLILLLSSLLLPLLAALPVQLLGGNPLDTSPSAVLREGLAFAILALLGAAVGLWWRPREWPLYALLFFAPFILLYSTLFTHPGGLAGGAFGALGYWLSQQAVHRGEQPLYYYALIQIPLYEFLPALGTLAAVVMGFRKRSWQTCPGTVITTTDCADIASQPVPTLALLIFWCASSFVAFTFAGEKMPWLTIHIALPMILATGWMAQYFSDTWVSLKGSRVWLHRIALAVFALLAVLTARAAYRAAFLLYDDPLEYLVYAHSAPDPKRLLAQVEDISRKTAGGLDLVVAYDGEVRYPYWWYLRHYPNRIDYGDAPTRDLRRAAIIFVGEPNYGKIEPIVRQDYVEFTFPRLWWPNQDYFALKWTNIDTNRRAETSANPKTLPPMTIWEYLRLSWRQVSLYLLDAAHRNALWQIWLNRNDDPYAQLTGCQTCTLSTWQPAQYMRMYLRKDIAAQVYGSGEKAEAPVDSYAPYRVHRAADSVIGSPGNSPAQFQSPRGVAVALDGSLYVADSKNHRIQHFSPDGKALQVWGTFGDVAAGTAPGGTFNEPWGVAVGPDGSIYVADTWNHRIQKFSSTGSFIQMWGTFGQDNNPEHLYGPRGIAVDARGQVYVTDTGNKRVVIFDADGKFIIQFGSDTLDEPVGIAIGPDDTIFVADTWNQRVVVYAHDQSGSGYTLIKSWPVDGWYGQSVENKPFLTVSENQVLVTDPEGCQVIAFSLEGTVERVWGACSGEIGMPTGIAGDPSGGLWISDAEHQRLLHFEE